MRTEKERINLRINKSLMDDLRFLVPAHERSRFVEEVLSRELRRLKLREAIKNAYGAWKDENHPDLATFEDINQWVEESRKIATRDFSKRP